jgi:hypothetical protein
MAETAQIEFREIATADHEAIQEFRLEKLRVGRHSARRLPV